MKLTEIVNQHRKIKAFLSENNINNYQIHLNGTVDVNADVDLQSCDFTVLPVIFGKITGNFNCANCKHLESLTGMPAIVGGSLDIRNCAKITSLSGFETSISGTFYCTWDNITRGGLGLLIHKVSKLGSARGPFKIIEKYLGKPNDIFTCQADLILAKYGDYAIL